MSNQKPKPITITLKYYNDEKIVELPLKYDDFIKNICSMLIIQIEFVKTFHFYYQKLCTNNIQSFQQSHYNFNYQSITY